MVSPHECVKVGPVDREEKVGPVDSEEKVRPENYRFKCSTFKSVVYI